MSLLLVAPDRPAGHPSGGDRYNASVASALRRRGRPVDVARVPGGWPRPDAVALDGLREALAGEGPVVVDGLVGCAAPGVVEETARRRPVVVLVHAVLAEGAGAVGEEAAELDHREGRALRAAAGVVATSRFAAGELQRRYGLTDVAVAAPGVDEAPLAPGSAGSGEQGPGAGVPQLLSLGAVTPVKNHALLLEALGTVADLPWGLVVAGPAPDEGHRAWLVEAAGRLGLAERVRWVGPLAGDDLEAVWAATDLLVHPSLSETFGMVVAEAHAHGIPTVVGAGTGAVEALTRAGEATGGRADDPPGAAVDTLSPEELAGALRRWLTDAEVRKRWRAAARVRRGRLPGWDATATDLAAAVDRARG